MEQKLRRKSKRSSGKAPLEEIQALEQEVKSLRQRADELEAEARKRLMELTCGTMAQSYGAFDSRAYAALFQPGGDDKSE